VLTVNPHAWPSNPFGGKGEKLIKNSLIFASTILYFQYHKNKFYPSGMASY
jgi:hypothetical protein